jgi:hypothetical protein
MAYDLQHVTKPMSLKILLAFILLSLTCSCNTRLYLPDRVNSPGLTKKHEAKLTAFAKVPRPGKDSFGRGSSISPAVDLAYSLSDHIGVIAGYRSTVNRLQPRDVSYPSIHIIDTPLAGRLNGENFELGAGYFRRFLDRGKMEIYAGVNLGELSRKSSIAPQFDFASKYYRVFIQPAVGLTGYDNFSASAGVKLSFTKFYSFDCAYGRMAADILAYDRNKTVTDVTFGYLEPFANVEVGYKFVKFNCQVGFSTPVTTYAMSTTSIFSFQAGAGITFHYDPAFFKKAK